MPDGIWHSFHVLAWSYCPNDQCRPPPGAPGWSSPVSPKQLLWLSPRDSKLSRSEMELIHGPPTLSSLQPVSAITIKWWPHPTSGQARRLRSAWTPPLPSWPSCNLSLRRVLLSQSSCLTPWLLQWPLTGLPAPSLTILPALHPHLLQSAFRSHVSLFWCNCLSVWHWKICCLSSLLVKVGLETCQRPEQMFLGCHDPRAPAVFWIERIPQWGREPPRVQELQCKRSQQFCSFLESSASRSLQPAWHFLPSRRKKCLQPTAKTYVCSDSFPLLPTYQNMLTPFSIQNFKPNRGCHHCECSCIDLKKKL